MPFWRNTGAPAKVNDPAFSPVNSLITDNPQMKDAADQRHEGPAPVCSWCDEPLSPEELAQSLGVCERCVRVLTAAGVPAAEIFRDKQRDEC